MKTTTTKTWLALCVSALAVTAAWNAMADDNTQATGSATGPMRRYTGTVVSVVPKDHLLSVKGWWSWEKKFNLGENCTYALLEKSSAGAADLRAGQKITVNYQDAHGVLIADRIVQEPMRYEGMVRSVDADRHELTLHRSGSTRQMVIADDCKIVLRNGRTGSFADIKTGNHVTVTYETPGDKPTARLIAQTSIPFAGTLTAIDLEDKTLKAKAAFTSKKFNVADNCAVVVNGKPDGKLADLKPNDKLVLSYDEINGINVVNRIALGETEPESVASSTTPMTQ